VPARATAGSIANATEATAMKAPPPIERDDGVARHHRTLVLTARCL
jgi:hypothetical protein